MPQGGSANCNSVVWPAMVMVPPSGTIEKTRNTGNSIRYGAAR